MACASVMCDCDPRTFDLCSEIASCAVTTPGLDSKELLVRNKRDNLSDFTSQPCVLTFNENRENGTVPVTHL
ncbi:hypothetical protein J6590_093892 [Homalodisca vitripennis]|nr:hypothetical protein J6590_093892 [Homalodisca vitripennis]